MLSLADRIAAHLQLDATTLALCWRITKPNGEFILGTDHDTDLAVVDDEVGGTYRSAAGILGSDIRSTSDMSVPNMEVQGAIRDVFVVADVSIADMESGLLDNAPCEVFLVNWQDPSGGVITRRYGVLGHFERDSNGFFQNEILGLVQLISQNIGESDGESCNAVFGDDRCKFPVATKTRTGTVTAVTSLREFTAHLDAGPAPIGDTYYNQAQLKFTSGENEDFVRPTKRVVFDADDVEIELWDEAPAEIEIGDTISLPPGCDFQAITCRTVHNNLVNIRADGLWVPGVLKMMEGPDGSSADD